MTAKEVVPAVFIRRGSENTGVALQKDAAPHYFPSFQKRP
jgi:hypothetical protein